MRPDNKALNNKRSAVRKELREQRSRAQDRDRQYAAQRLRDFEARYGNNLNYKAKQEQALLYGTAAMAQKVLGAFNVATPVQVSTLSPSNPASVRAYTDFTRLYIQVKAGVVDLTDIDSVAEFIKMIKGATYHEGGHIKFTLPLQNLRDHCVTVGYNEFLVRTTGELARPWNILEDQRMETAMVLESPILARYFTSIVLNVVIDKSDIGRSWPYLYGRQYLKHELREKIRRLAMKRSKAHLIPEIEDCIDTYKSTNDYTVMAQQVVRFADLMKEWGMPPEGAGETTHDNTARRNNTPQPIPPDEMVQSEEFDVDEDQEPNEEPPPEGQPGGESEGGDPAPSTGEQEAEGDGEGESQQGEGAEADSSEGSGTEGDENGDGDATAGQKQESASSENSSHGDGTGRGKSSTDDTKKEVEDLLDEIDKDLTEQFNNEAKTFAGAINEESHKDLPRDKTGYPMSGELIAQAASVKGGIVAALEHLIDQTSPSWRFNLESGVLDPTAYVMREPGDTDYWSGLDDVGGQGYDLAVSVMLDTSGSMWGQEDNLSVIALGIRSACDELEIPCSVSTFNTYYGAVYRDDEPTVPTTIQSTGGTEPWPLFDFLDSQRKDKRRHLVVILTDGQWERATGKSSLQPWGAPGRYFLLVGLNTGYAVLRDKNADATIVIHELGDLAKEFTKALSGFLA